jgi:ergothioneine biosynthesis protein EgtB
MTTTGAIRKTMEEVRAHTLRLLASINEADFFRQIHPDFSPIGWHLGHIGVTEAYWILQQCKGEASLSVSYDVFFSPTDNPKPNRVNLPSRAEILDYLLTVRERIFSFLAHANFASDHLLLQEANIFHMLIQHEEQHNETMLLIVRLLAAERYDAGIPHSHRLGLRESEPAVEKGEMVLVPAGPFLMGSNHRSITLDNERPQQVVEVGDYLIDRYPVTNLEFLQFVIAGGYDIPQWWSGTGWQWRERQQIQHPLYWRQQASGGWAEIGMEAVSPLALEQPVMCVSWYEADAYARFMGKRLPTETEWEKAAACEALAKIGCVWEWTTTWFQPYPGFAAHPYPGYSMPYFDNQHRILRGGSWATRPHVRRRTFRNWYHPWVREIFAGFRCAQDVNAVTV